MLGKIKEGIDRILSLPSFDEDFSPNERDHELIINQYGEVKNNKMFYLEVEALTLLEKFIELFQYRQCEDSYYHGNVSLSLENFPNSCEWVNDVEKKNPVLLSFMEIVNFLKDEEISRSLKMSVSFPIVD